MTNMQLKFSKVLLFSSITSIKYQAGDFPRKRDPFALLLCHLFAAAPFHNLAGEM